MCGRWLVDVVEDGIWSGSFKWAALLAVRSQFGLSNQLVALRNAVAWAQLLNCTLVLPHLLAHGAVRPRAPFGMAFAAHDARTKLALLEVIEIDDFLRLGLAPAGVVALATTNKFRPADDTGYFDFDVKRHRAPTDRLIRWRCRWGRRFGRYRLLTRRHSGRFWRMRSPPPGACFPLSCRLRPKAPRATAAWLGVCGVEVRRPSSRPPVLARGAAMYRSARPSA